MNIMKKVKVIIDRAGDGTYNAYCKECPTLFGMGDTVAEAQAELNEGIRILKEEIGRENAAQYPDWLDYDYELEYQYDVQGFMEYYAGIFTPTALGNLANINSKQMWNYMHGVAKPRKAQVDKIEKALHQLGAELLNISF